MACYPSGITGHVIYVVNMQITDHLLFQCQFLTRARNLVKGWLEIAGIDQDHFNKHTLIEMTEVDALQNNVMSNYKDIILKNRKLAQRHDVKINEQATP